jgi:putative hydrolase of the HAD superfamily
VIRAVIFDLWDTLVDFDPVRSKSFQDELARRLGRDPEEFAAVWDEGRPDRETGPLRRFLAGLGADDGIAAEALTLRLESTRSMLRPRPGAVETLAELRRRGYGLGLISVCSDDVTELWEETPFAGMFDSTVFSCAVALRKPQPEIYRLALDELGVDPAEAIFVGDGANDELAGAERVGIRAVLIHREGEQPLWDEVRDWQGPRITAVPQVLALLPDERTGTVP